MSPKELTNLWIVPPILMVVTSLNAMPTLNSANAEALTIDNNSTLVKSINATNSVNTTDSEDKEYVNESEKEEEEDNDIEEEDD